MSDSRVIKTTLELSGEGTYTKKLKEIKQVMQGVDSEFKAVNAQFDKNDKSLAALTARYGAYEDKLDLQRKALKLIREEYNKIVEAEGENSDAARRLAIEYNNMLAKTEKTEKALAQIGKQMKINAKEADEAGQQLRKAAEAIEEYGDAVQAAAGKIKKSDSAIKNFASEQKVLDAQYAKNDKSIEALTQRYKSLEKALELQKGKLAAVGDMWVAVAEAQGEESEAAQRVYRDYHEVEAEIVKMERDLGELEQSIKATTETTEDAEDTLDSTAKAEEKLGDAAQKASGKLGKVGDASKMQTQALKTLQTQAERTADRLSDALTGATIATVTASAKAYMDFGTQMSNVATLADTTAVSMEELSAQALKASDDAHTAAENIAQGAYEALSSGIDTASVMRFTTEAAKAAKAGQGELTEVIGGATSAMNAWKIANTESTSVFEKMLVAQDKGKTTLGELSGQIGQITGLAPQLNISLDEILAATAALTKNGVQTSSAITGLRAVMSNVIKPTAEAAKAAEEMGLEFNAAALQSKGLTGFLQDVLDKTGGSTEELAKLFGSVEGLSQVMLLGGSAAADYEDALDAMANSTGRLDKAFNTVTDNSAAKMQAALNKLKNNAIQFGQTLSPYIDMASGSLEKLSERISAMSATEQKALLQTALWTAGGLKAVSMLSKMVTVVRALGAAAGPVGLAATAIGAVTAAIIALNKAADERNLEKTWDSFREAANENISGNMAATINATVDASPAKASIETAVEELRTALKDIDVLDDNERNAIIDVITGDVGAITSALTSAGLTTEEAEDAGSTITQAWDNFKNAVGDIEGIENIDQITTLIGEDYDKVVEALKTFGLSDADATKVATELQTYQDTVGSALSEFDVFGREEIITFSKAVSNDKLALINMLRRFGLKDSEINSIVEVYNASINSLTGKMMNVYEAIGKKLTDGEADTTETVDALKKGVADLFTDAETKLDGMGEKAGGYAATLESLEKETVEWIGRMAGQSTDYVLAHLGELEAIQAKVQEVTAEIDAANNALMSEGKISYDLTTAGATTNQDTIAKGIQYAYQNYKLDTQAIEEEAAARMAEADRAFANGITDAAQHLQAEQVIEEWQSGEAAKLEQTYREQMSKLLQGVYEAYAESTPEEAALVKEISDKLNAADILIQSIEQIGAAGSEAEVEAAKERIRAAYESVFGIRAEDIKTGDAPAIAEQLYADVNNALKELPMENGGFVDTLMEIFASDAANPLDIDTTSMEDVFRAAMGNVGGAGIDGIVEGLADPDDKTVTAAESLAGKTAEAAGDAFGSSASASAYEGVGAGVVQSIIDGIGKKEAELDARIAALAQKAIAAAQQADALINGVSLRAAQAGASTGSSRATTGGSKTSAQTVVQSRSATTVNVSYSGAFTKREAKRFGTALAGQIASEIAAKGG